MWTATLDSDPQPALAGGVDAAAARLAPSAVRYIKLGPSGAWLRRCLAEGVLELGHRAVPHALAAAGDWEAIERGLVAEGRTSGKAADFTREVRDFYTLGTDAMWITIGDGRLWWAFAQAQVTSLPEGEGHGARARAVRGSWSCLDALGGVLALNTLSTRLTKVAAYRQTLCRVGAQDYLLRRLNGQVDPAVAAALKAEAAAVEAARGLIAGLDWRDFELLVDLIFAQSGWRRRSAVGGAGQADTDLVLEQAVTGETAFVQVKSAASPAVFANYLDRFAAAPGVYDRLFFVCHSPSAALVGKPDAQVHLWLADEVAQQAVRAGLLGWLVTRAG